MKFLNTLRCSDCLSLLVLQMCESLCVSRVLSQTSLIQILSAGGIARHLPSPVIDYVQGCGVPIILKEFSIK